MAVLLTIAQLSILSEMPPTLGGKKFSELPVTHAVALDPWMEPLPSPGPAPVHSASPPLLVVNSEDFTFWTEHFARLRAMVDLWTTTKDDSSASSEFGTDSEHAAPKGTGIPNGRLFTLVKAAHVSFSDFPLFFAMGWMGRGARRITDVTYDLVYAFLEGDLEGALKRQRVASGAEKIQHKRGGGKRHRFVGAAGDIVVHV